jgi:hypothetical protein
LPDFALNVQFPVPLVFLILLLIGLCVGPLRFPICHLPFAIRSRLLANGHWLSPSSGRAPPSIFHFLSSIFHSRLSGGPRSFRAPQHEARSLSLTPCFSGVYNRATFLLTVLTVCSQCSLLGSASKIQPNLPLENSLTLPQPGFSQLTILSPNVLELTLITTAPSVRYRVTNTMG